MLITQQLKIYSTPEVVFNHSQQGIFEPLMLSPHWQCYENQTPKLNTSHRFQLVSWNIHKGADVGWQKTLIKLAQNTDFVLLQEATSLQQIALQLPQFSSYLHTFAFQFRQQKTGVLNLSSLNADLYCVNSLQEPLLRLPKVMAAMRFPFEDGKSLLIINVHLINFEWNIQSYQKQLDALRTLIDAHHGAVILAGDFNTWNQRRKKQLLTMVEALSLQEVPLMPDERITAFGHPLDHIFTRHIVIHSALSHRVKSSDHNPIELRFSLE